MKKARIRVMWILAFFSSPNLYCCNTYSLKNSKVNAPYRQSEYLLENAH